jgi:hypothetical protein
MTNDPAENPRKKRVAIYFHLKIFTGPRRPEGRRGETCGLALSGGAWKPWAS